MTNGSTHSARALYQMVRADFLERVRRYSFLVTLAASLHLAYGVAAEKVWTVVGNGYRGVYNSAWIGMLMTICCSTFLSLAGFYIVKNSVQRDTDTRVGQILAATPMRKDFYTIAKTLSNFRGPRVHGRRPHAGRGRHATSPFGSPHSLRLEALGTVYFSGAAHDAPDGQSGGTVRDSPRSARRRGQRRLFLPVDRVSRPRRHWTRRPQWPTASLSQFAQRSAGDRSQQPREFSLQPHHWRRARRPNLSLEWSRLDRQRTPDAFAVDRHRRRSCPARFAFLPSLRSRALLAKAPSSTRRQHSRLFNLRRTLDIHSHGHPDHRRSPHAFGPRVAGSRHRPPLPAIGHLRASPHAQRPALVVVRRRRGNTGRRSRVPRAERTRRLPARCLDLADPPLVADGLPRSSQRHRADSLFLRAKSLPPVSRLSGLLAYLSPCSPALESEFVLL